MSDRKRILLIYNGTPNSTSGQLFTALKSFLEQRHDCVIAANPSPGKSVAKILRSLMSNFARMRSVIRSDVMILHTSALVSLPNLIFARLIGKRVVLFQWDIYPSTFANEIVSQSRWRTIIDVIEDTISRLASVIVIPSSDFQPFVRKHDTIAMPIWPSKSRQEQSREPLPTDRPIRICFIGQINRIRALLLSLRHIRRVSSAPLELHVYSQDALPEGLDALENLQIIHQGHIEPNELARQLETMHFGLISLHPLLDQPGFPSKVFDYAAAGLPILYFGRSLPAFEALFEEAGLGINVTDQTAVDLQAEYQRIAENMEGARAVFDAKTALSWDKIDEILGV